MKDLVCPSCGKVLKKVEIPTKEELLEEVKPKTITITCNKCHIPVEFDLTAI